VTGDPVELHAEFRGQKCLFRLTRPVVTRGDSFCGRVALKLVMKLVSVKLVIYGNLCLRRKATARSDWYTPWAGISDR